jgi:GT2 family glycosyltransferase
MVPKVSVVTPVYNGEAHFETAIPSILGQSLDDFEFIIVDDGSQDRTPISRGRTSMTGAIPTGSDFKSIFSTGTLQPV